MDYTTNASILNSYLAPFINIHQKIAEFPIVLVDQIYPIWADLLKCHYGRSDDQSRSVAEQLFQHSHKLVLN